MSIEKIFPNNPIDAIYSGVRIFSTENGGYCLKRADEEKLTEEGHQCLFSRPCLSTFFIKREKKKKSTEEPEPGGGPQRLRAVLPASYFYLYVPSYPASVSYYS